MKVVVQRVSRAKVSVDNEVVGEIGRGFLVLVGVEQGDDEKDAEFIIKKLVGLRIFNDEQGKMNLSIENVNGQMLLVSQFTLLGDCKKGNRPSFINAASPEEGNRLYEFVVHGVKARGIAVQTGRFQAEMNVDLVNEGPVTLIINSRER